MWLSPRPAKVQALSLIHIYRIRRGDAESFFQPGLLLFEDLLHVGFAYTVIGNDNLADVYKRHVEYVLKLDAAEKARYIRAEFGHGLDASKDPAAPYTWLGVDEFTVKMCIRDRVTRPGRRFPFLYRACIPKARAAGHLYESEVLA